MDWLFRASARAKIRLLGPLLGWRWVTLSRRESRAQFNHMVRSRLGITPEEFLRRMDAGELNDTPLEVYLSFIAGHPPMTTYPADRLS